MYLDRESKLIEATVKINLYGQSKEMLFEIYTYSNPITGELEVAFEDKEFFLQETLDAMRRMCALQVEKNIIQEEGLGHE